MQIEQKDHEDQEPVVCLDCVYLDEPIGVCDPDCLRNPKAPKFVPRGCSTCKHNSVPEHLPPCRQCLLDVDDEEGHSGWEEDKEGAWLKNL